MFQSGDEEEAEEEVIVETKKSQRASQLRGSRKLNSEDSGGCVHWDRCEISRP